LHTWSIHDNDPLPSAAWANNSAVEAITVSRTVCFCQGRTGYPLHSIKKNDLACTGVTTGISVRFLWPRVSTASQPSSSLSSTVVRSLIRKRADSPLGCVPALKISTCGDLYLVCILAAWRVYTVYSISHDPLNQCLFFPCSFKLSLVHVTYLLPSIFVTQFSSNISNLLMQSPLG